MCRKHLGRIIRYLPSQEEIRKARDKIKKNWTSKQREARRIVKGALPFEVPVVPTPPEFIEDEVI